MDVQQSVNEWNENFWKTFGKQSADGNEKCQTFGNQSADLEWNEVLNFWKTISWWKWNEKCQTFGKQSADLEWNKKVSNKQPISWFRIK